MTENERIFLDGIPASGTDLYKTIIADIKSQLPHCHICFTSTKTNKDCRIKVGKKVAGWFWWQQKAGSFKVLLKAKKSSFFNLRLNSAKDSTDSS